MSIDNNREYLRIWTDFYKYNLIQAEQRDSFPNPVLQQLTPTVKHNILFFKHIYFIFILNSSFP